MRSGGFFRVGKAQQWRDVKDQSVFQPLLDKFSRLMRRYGYLKGAEPSARRSATPGAAKQSGDARYADKGSSIAQNSGDRYS